MAELASQLSPVNAAMPIPCVWTYVKCAHAGQVSNPLLAQKDRNTEADRACRRSYEGVARRELAGFGGCAVFLSTALGGATMWGTPRARRRIRSSLGRDCSKPHPVLVSLLGRAASPQILRRAGLSIRAS